MASAEYAALRSATLSEDIEPLTIELVFDTPRAQADIAARLTTALPGAETDVDLVFETDADRYVFVTFPTIDPRGQEPQVFAFARAFGPAMEAQEANPVLTDSLYGAAHVADESLFGMSCETPRDNSRPFGWHHARLKTPLAWQTTRGQGSTVAVIDTGYSSHNELHQVIKTTGQWNFVEGNDDARDRFSTGLLKHPGHGTLVASVVASRGSADMAGNTTRPGGVTGTAPEAKVLPIRAIKSVIDMTQRRIAKAINHAVAQKADVIVMALGGPTRVASTEKALRDAVNAGTVIVCAAGNCYPNVVFPAAYASMGLCTAVAALRPDKKPWDKTGRGPQVSFAAYGEQVWGAAKNKASDPDAGIRSSQGTTLATSMTGGVAALWVAAHGGRAVLLAKARAAGTTVQAMWLHASRTGMSKPSEWGGANDLGAGILDAQNALAAALPTGAESVDAPEPDATPTINVLVEHLAGLDGQAADEITPDMAPYAPEILWLSYRRGARARLLETETEAVLSDDTVTPALQGALSDKPALNALLGTG